MGRRQRCNDLRHTFLLKLYSYSITNWWGSGYNTYIVCLVIKQKKSNIYTVNFLIVTTCRQGPPVVKDHFENNRLFLSQMLFWEINK